MLSRMIRALTAMKCQQLSAVHTESCWHFIAVRKVVSFIACNFKCLLSSSKQGRLMILGNSLSTTWCTYKGFMFSMYDVVSSCLTAVVTIEDSVSWYHLHVLNHVLNPDSVGTRGDQ